MTPVRSAGVSSLIEEDAMWLPTNDRDLRLRVEANVYTRMILGVCPDDVSDEMSELVERLVAA